MRVTKCLIMIFAVLLVVPSVAAFAGSGPVTRDAVTIGQPTATASADNATARRVTVPLLLDNTHELVAMDIPLRFGQPGDGIQLASVRFGSRVDYFNEKITKIDNESKTVVMGLIAMAYDPNTSDLESGSGAIAELTFDITDPTIESFTIASTRTEKPNHRLMLVWHEYNADGQPEVRWNEDLDFELAVNVTSAGASPVPMDYALDQNYPNPFNAGTVIRFANPQAGQVKVSVFNVLGQTVRTLHDGDMEAGYHNLSWNGDDENGNTAASGVYFYRVQSKGYTATKKMTLLK